MVRMQGLLHVLHLLHLAQPTRDQARGIRVHCSRMQTTLRKSGENRIHSLQAKYKFLFQISLSRHVNSHFKTPGGSSTTSNNNNNTKKQSNGNNSSPVKFYIRKTRRKLRSGVSHVNHLKMSEDTFHLGIMAGIKDGLSRISHSSHNSDNVPFIFDNCGADLVFRSEVKSRKLDENGNIQYLVTWLPEGM